MTDDGRLSPGSGHREAARGARYSGQLPVTMSSRHSEAEDSNQLLRVNVDKIQRRVTMN